MMQRHWTFKAGKDAFDVMDTFGRATGVLMTATFEMIGIMCVYAVNRFSFDLQFMLGIKPNLYCKFCLPRVSLMILNCIYYLMLCQFINASTGIVIPMPYIQYAL